MVICDETRTGTVCNGTVIDECCNRCGEIGGYTRTEDGLRTFVARWWTGVHWTSGTFHAPTAQDVHESITRTRGQRITVNQL